MKWTAHLEGGPMRVNHAAARVGDKIYSFGGYCSTDDYMDWQPIPVHVLEPTTLRWTQVNFFRDETELPFERYGHSAVAYGDKVYLWGGRNNAVQCEMLACFDTKTHKWSYPKVSGQVPLAKDGHTACLIRNRMYVFGGFEYHTDQYSLELHYLDLDTMEWECVVTEGISPSHRDFHTAVAYDDKMYVFGGRGDLNSPYNSQEEVYCPQLFILETKDTHRWRLANPSGVWPGSRRSHSAWVYNEHMYIFGGYNGLSQSHFNDVWRYSFKNNHWSYWPLQGTPPCKRRRQQCVIFDSKMFLFGGTSPGTHVCPVTQQVEPNVILSHKADGLIDNSDMHVLDFAPTLKTLAICKVLELELDTSSLPWDVKMDIRIMTVRNKISCRRETNQTG